MLTCKHAITSSRGLIEGVQTRPAVHTGMCLTGVTDSSDRVDEKNACQHPEGWEETEIHSQTCPERHLPRVSKLRNTSAAGHICTKGSTMCDAVLRNRAAKEKRVLMAQLLYSGFLFSTPSGCVSISFGQKYPCLSLVVHEFPRGAKHNPKTPDAELHVFKIKSQAVTFEVYRQAVQSGLNPQTEQGLSPFRLLPL